MIDQLLAFSLLFIGVVLLVVHFAEIKNPQKPNG